MDKGLETRAEENRINRLERIILQNKVVVLSQVSGCSSPTGWRSLFLTILGNRTFVEQGTCIKIYVSSFNRSSEQSHFTDLEIKI